MRATGLSLIGLALLAAPAALLSGEVEGDLKKIQGTWRFVSHEMDGKAMPKDEATKLTITFSGNKWTVRSGDKVVQAGTHKLDGSKTPGQVDAKVTEGEGKGSDMVGIYELKGKTMKVCFDLKGKERPTSFVSKEGQFAAVIQREKKK